MRRDERPYSALQENLNTARTFVELAGLKEIREKIRGMRPLAIIRDTIFPLRRILKDTADKLYEVGLPQVLVFVVSCLEAYLKESYQMLKGELLTAEEERVFLRLERVRELFSEILKADVLEGDEELFRRAQVVIEKRHIIVHRAGIIDQKAYDVFREAGIYEGEVGSKLRLSADKVKQDIDVVEAFARKIEMKIFSSA